MRIRAPLLLCLLVGCSYVTDENLLEANIVSPGNFIAGSGVIQSVGVLRGARAPGTGADSQGSHPDRNLYRLYLLMDAGGFQTVDIDSSRFLAGEAVELTNDGRVARVSGTTFNEQIRRERY
jgi:hypothetical protein